MIDPNIWHSEDYSKLSVLARLVFIGMFSNADDEGRGRAKPIYLRSILFPYDDGARLIDMEKALSEIGSNMSVTFYVHNGNQYYQLNNWSNWQRVEKPQKSQIPPPENTTLNTSPKTSTNATFKATSNTTNFSNSVTECTQKHSTTVPRTVVDESCLRERKGKEVKLKGERVENYFIPLSPEQQNDLFSEFGKSNVLMYIDKVQEFNQKKNIKPSEKDYRMLVKWLNEDKSQLTKDNNAVNNSKSSFDINEVEALILQKYA